MPGAAAKDRHVELLAEVARVLTRSLDLGSTMREILALLDRLMEMNRGTITLLDEETGVLSIVAAYGMPPEAIRKGRYLLGEGITGHVVKTGKAEVVPQMSKDPRFLNRTGTRDKEVRANLSFLCVPIKVDDKILGALSVDRAYRPRARFDDDLHLLEIVASIVGRAVHLNRLVREDKASLVDENLDLRRKLKERYEIRNLVGNSSAMREVYALIEQVARSNATVLIRGETGTGKELVAHAIHYNSPRNAKPFIKVNCAALPGTLLESELFGYEKGAFTGAARRKPGRFELADGGTLFLDEIGDLPKDMQAKLLRVLQTREFERVGGTATIKVDVRLLAATSKDLEREVAAGNFREDLYYRINVFPIFLPPLREKKDDITLLADHFLEKYAKQHNKDIRRISTTAINLLMSYHWPGNVRELENCLERAVLLCNERTIRAEHLPPSLQTAETSGSRLRGKLPETIANVEQEMILEALKTTGGHQGKAARLLGVTERMLGYKIRKYRITPKVYAARKGKGLKAADR